MYVDPKVLYRNYFNFLFPLRFCHVDIVPGQKSLEETLSAIETCILLEGARGCNILFCAASSVRIVM